MTRLRWYSQIFFLMCVLVLTFRNLSGISKATIESYCPVGGLEGIFFYLKNNSFLCATSGINLIFFVAVLLGTISIGRAFCSWVCPVGSIVEFLAKAGKRLSIAPKVVWSGPFRHLAWFKFVVLGLVLYYTHQVLDLVFRAYCPYFVALSGQDHGSEWWSKWLVLFFGILSLFIPFFWCRVLCPFGGFLALTKRISPVAPKIWKNLCSQCTTCESVCPQQVEIVEESRVRSLECTQCLSCIESCPEKCLHLSVGYYPDIEPEIKKNSPAVSFGRKISPGIIPVGIFAMMFGGYFFSVNYPIPTVSIQFPAISSPRLEKVEMVIAGLKCRGTSNTLTKILESTSGVASLETFVSEFKAVILYNSNQIDVQSIQRAIEAGIDLKDHKTGMMKRFFPFKVEKIL